MTPERAHELRLKAREKGICGQLVTDVPFESLLYRRVWSAHGKFQGTIIRLRRAPAEDRHDSVDILWDAFEEDGTQTQSLGAFYDNLELFLVEHPKKSEG